MSARLHIVRLSAGELPHPWIVTDDSDTLDKRPGRWTNGGQGWRTREAALDALAEIEAEETDR